MITITDVTVPRAAVAHLAAVLTQHGNGSRIVGYRLGQAIDGNRDSLTLTAEEENVILHALTANPIDDLEPLRERLQTPFTGEGKRQ